ncbi:MAG: DNA adenine methylase [Bdellovibrionales bacterium]|nr:DNA adenine methylase [Bdellovibrionales bacterium]
MKESDTTSLRDDFLEASTSYPLHVEEGSLRKPLPFVKWAGGKRQMLPELRKRVPKKFNRYFEPFVGGGALFFDLLPESAVLNDSNRELINVYHVVRDQVDELIEDLSQHRHDADYFYELRDADRSEEYVQWSAVTKASRFIYLNKTCFNGLYRVNQKGFFNTPFGKYVNPKILDEANLKVCSSALKSVTLVCDSFLDLEQDIEEHDFVYFDPPYVPLSETANFTGYQADGFDLDMHIELRNLCRRLSEKGVQILLSNSSAPLVTELYKGFKIKKVQANRAINSQGAKRGSVFELLISNY